MCGVIVHGDYTYDYLNNRRRLTVQSRLFQPPNASTSRPEILIARITPARITTFGDYSFLHQLCRECDTMLASLII